MLTDCPECEGMGFIDACCGFCSGSGEGMYDGSRCHACKGSGDGSYQCPECDGEGTVDVEIDEDDEDMKEVSNEKPD